MEAPLIDWSRPQRQPWRGFAITLFKVSWQALRILAPVLIVRLITRTKPADDPHAMGLKLIAAVGLLLATVLVVALVRQLFFRFYIKNGELLIHEGWLVRKTSSIPLDRIQSVEVDEDLLHRLLGLVKLRIETAGSAKTEAAISALRRPMAEALRDALLQNRISTDEGEIADVAKPDVVLQLSGADLLRLSLTANHLEAFVLLLTFGWGLYDDLRPVMERFFPGRAELAAAGIKMLLALGIAVLVITLLYSALRTMLRFYDYRVLRDDKGYSLRFGLIDRRQRLVPFEKIQYLEWRASWLRRLFGLWLLELGVVGEKELKSKQRLEIPLTGQAQVAPLTLPYHQIPDVAALNALRIHRSYAQRRLLLVGLIPVSLLLPPFLHWGGPASLWMLLWPAFTALMSTLRQRKFRLWMHEDVLYLRGGLLGESFTLLKWYKVQSVRMVQSPYQRSHALASLVLHTAAGNIKIPWIPLAAARAIADYALYKVESEERVWM
jgi:putative membrane protein